MLTKLRLRGLLRPLRTLAALALCGLLTVVMLAQRAMTVAEVVTFIKNQIKAKGDDRTTGELQSGYKVGYDI
jgi:hypothetical protein